jgi:hypothetical protein
VAKEHLARINLLEEREDNLPRQHPPRLSAMIHKRCHLDVETDSDECFDLSEANHGSDLDMDSDSQPVSLKAAKTITKVCVSYLGWATIYDLHCQPSQGKKRVKGAARQELMARTKELHHSVKHVAKRQKSQGDIRRYGACMITSGWLADL